jgi:hypothetical protein
MRNFVKQKSENFAEFRIVAYGFPRYFGRFLALSYMK